MTVAQVVARRALEDAEAEAVRARKVLAKFDHESDLAREMGELLSHDFYLEMAEARAEVGRRQRDVAKAREKLEAGT